MPEVPLNLLVQLPDEGTLQRLVDGEPLLEVARHPDVFLFVIKHGVYEQIFAEDPR